MALPQATGLQLVKYVGWVTSYHWFLCENLKTKGKCCSPTYRNTLRTGTLVQASNGIFCAVALKQIRTVLWCLLTCYVTPEQDVGEPLTFLHVCVFRHVCLSLVMCMCLCVCVCVHISVSLGMCVCLCACVFVGIYIRVCLWLPDCLLLEEDASSWPMGRGV